MYDLNAINPALNSVQDLYEQAQACLLDGKLVKAIATCEKILAIDPDFVDAYQTMGDALKAMGKPEAATLTYAKAADVFVRWGEALAQQGKIASAIAQYKKALELTPDLPEAYIRVVQTYFWSGQYSEGFEFMRSALALPPDRLDLEKIIHPEFWLEMNPELSINGDSNLAESKVDISPEQIEILSDRMRTEGYFQIDDLLPALEIEKLRVGIERLRANGIRPVFILVYDQVWQMFQRLSPILSAILGADYRQFPGFWAWFIDPQQSERGWRPHIDRTDSPLRSDRMTDTVNIWIALTEATPLNGCMYIVPANLDPTYGTSERPTEYHAGFDLQSIRALPAKAGSVLCWNGLVYHWGGSSSQGATHARISIANDFQRGDVRAYEQPLLDPFTRLSLSDRLGLVGLQTLRYRHIY
jgi:tetratricopeptide (TPR) repeat protein